MSHGGTKRATVKRALLYPDRRPSVVLKSNSKPKIKFCRKDTFAKCSVVQATTFFKSRKEGKQERSQSVTKDQRIQMPSGSRQYVSLFFSLSLFISTPSNCTVLSSKREPWKHESRPEKFPNRSQIQLRQGRVHNTSDSGLIINKLSLIAK